MQSKTSCFNVGIFKSNLKRFWPGAALAFIIFFGLLPFNFYTEWSYRKSFIAEELSDLLYFVPSNLTYLNVPFIEFVAAGVAVILIFGYMFNTRSAYMMSAFPVERKTWLFTNVVSLLFLEIVPMILNVILTAIFCGVNGMGNVSYLLFFLVQNICYFLIFDGIAMVSVFISGNYLGAAGSYVVLNFLSYMAVSFVYSLQHIFLLGYSPLNLVDSARENWLSPCLYLSRRHIGIVCSYENEALIPTVTLEGIPALIIYSLAGIALMTVCLLIGKMRRTETAGDLISFEWVKKTFQIIVSAFLSVLVSELIVTNYQERFIVSYTEAFFMMILGVVIIGFIVFYAFEMFAKKTIRIFNFKQLKQFLIYSAGIIVVMTIVKCDPIGFEKKLPEAKDVEWAGFSYDCGYVYTTSDAKEILAIQKMFVDNRTVLKNIKEPTAGYAGGLTFKYKKKDGSYEYRRYIIADIEGCKSLYDSLISEIKDPERMKTGMIHPDWARVKAVSGEYYKETPIAVDYGMEWESTWDELKLSADQVDELYHAVLKDIDEGNVNPIYAYADESKYINQLNFNLSASNLGISCDEQFNDYVNDVVRIGTISDTYFSINLEPSMRNTIDKMIELGVIGSENELIMVTEIE